MRLHLIKMLNIFIILMLILSFICNVSIAAFDVKSNFQGGIDSNAEDAKNAVKGVILEILTAVRIAGIAIAMIILIAVGIKIMSAAPSERANIKQYAINYLIGIIILVGATVIIGIIQDVAKGAFE